MPPIWWTRSFLFPLSHLILLLLASRTDIGTLTYPVDYATDMVAAYNKSRTQLRRLDGGESAAVDKHRSEAARISVVRIHRTGPRTSSFRFLAKTVNVALSPSPNGGHRCQYRRRYNAAANITKNTGSEERTPRTIPPLRLAHGIKSRLTQTGATVDTRWIIVRGAANRDLFATNFFRDRGRQLPGRSPRRASICAFVASVDVTR